MLLRTLIGDYIQEIYFETPEENDNKIVRGFNTMNSKGDSAACADHHKHNALSNEANVFQTKDYIMRDLFLWAILTNRINTAKVLLYFMKYRICPALIAMKILREFHKTAEYGHLKDNYSESIDYFEKYAIDCMDICDDDDPHQTCEIILQQNELYGYVTCLQVNHIFMIHQR